MKTIHLEDVQKDVIKKLESQNKEMLECLKKFYKYSISSCENCIADCQICRLTELKNIIEKNKDN